MKSASNAVTDAAVIQAFATIPALLDQTPALIARGRFLNCECLLGPNENPFHVSIRQGRIIDLTPAPVLMRSWRFSFRASATAWAAYWQPVPQPGWHDLLALTKRARSICSPASMISPARRKTASGRLPASRAPASPSWSNSAIFR
jgi:hypothetical protein